MFLGKPERYTRLVACRRNCRLCEGLLNPAVVSDGAFDSDEIGPWSRWQGNLDAEIVIVGQDWGDIRYFETHQGVEGPRNPTNLNLVKLLREVSVAISDPPGARTDDAVFLTNAILCVKQEGGLQGKVRREWFDNCGRKFLVPLLKIISPRVMVALGELAFRAVIRNLQPEFKMPSRFRDAVEGVGRSGGVPVLNGCRFFPVYHCGARVMNTHRSFDEQQRDWRRIRESLEVSGQS